MILLAHLIHSRLVQGEAAFPWNQNPELTDYATMMAIIYNMMKQDFLMQVLISLWLSIIFYILNLAGNN